jgi:hypothetical protein
MPRDLFSTDVAVGDVYRIGVNLFRAAFCDSRIARGRFESLIQEFRGLMEISAEETKAFGVWSSETIEHIARREPKNAELKLQPKRER